MVTPPESVNRVGVVGPSEGEGEGARSTSPAAVEGALDEHIAVSSVNPAGVEDVDADLVLAVGERAVVELARLRCDRSVLPVSAGVGLRSIDATAVQTAVASIESGEATVVAHPILAVAVDGDAVCTGLLDAVVATEPARISAFEVTADGERVDRFRADGVVLATPAGTPNYARTVGCPVIPPGMDVLAGAPIAPFTTDPDHWVLPLGEVSVTPTRDEATVELQVDGRAVAEVASGNPVTVEVAGHLRALRVPEGHSPFDGGARESEKL